MKFKFSFLLFKSLFFAISCGFVTFDYENIKCNIKESDRYFEEKEIILTLSEDFNENEIKNCIEISEENMSVIAEYVFNDREVRIWPEKGWKSGKKYTFKINGNLQIGNQKRVCQLQRQFIYGKRCEEFLLVSSSDFSSNRNLHEELFLSFNKEIDAKSFCNNFSIIPSMEYRVSFSEEKTEVSIIPINGWVVNERYKISLDDFTSKDGYYIKPAEFSFIPVADHVIPEFVKVCPVKLIEDNYIFETSLELDEFIGKKEIIGFTFSKSMDYDSVKRNIKFSPSIAGHFIQCEYDDSKFVFIPEENFKTGGKYRITISDKISDLYGNQLKETTEICFVSKRDYLNVSGVSIGNQKINMTEKNSTVVVCTRENNLGTVSISIAFDSDISNKVEACNCIRMDTLFPFSAKIPVKKSIIWTDDAHVIMDFCNLTLGSQNEPVYYEIKIYGGEDGIINCLNEFMKESICFVIQTE